MGCANRAVVSEENYVSFIRWPQDRGKDSRAQSITIQLFQRQACHNRFKFCSQHSSLNFTVSFSLAAKQSFSVIAAVFSRCFTQASHHRASVKLLPIIKIVINSASHICLLNFSIFDKDLSHFKWREKYSAKKDFRLKVR